MSLRATTFAALCFVGQGLSASTVDPDQRLSAEEFSRYVTGKTLTYSKAGQIFGAEEYLSGNRVRWSFNDGQCQDGRWYEKNEQICFVYENQPVPQCWTFYVGETGLIALYENAPSTNNLLETAQKTEPLLCFGPDVGV